jgi:hypothetical protein
VREPPVAGAKTSPPSPPPLRMLLSWATAEHGPASEEVPPALADDGVVAAVVERFADIIGLWADDGQEP